MLIKSTVFGAVLLAGASIAAQAQSPYPVYPYTPAPPPSPAQALPPSWSYDPYTSGLGPCPQWRSGDLVRCRDQMPPTQGQPSFWSPAS